MSDTTTVWSRDLGRGDWVLDPFTVTRQPVTVAPAAQFGTGDGSTTQFSVIGGAKNIDTIVAASVFRNDWQGNQLLYPTPRTNRVQFSEQLGNAAWFKSNCTITPNATPAPDPSKMAEAVVRTTAANHYLGQALAGVVAAGKPFTAFVYLKSGSYTGLVRVWLKDGAGASLAAVNVQPTPTWQLFAVSGTYPAGASGAPTLYIDPSDDVGVAGDTFYAWGADVKDGLQQSAYIPTTNTAVTLTDYVLSNNGLISLAQAPAAGATLTWLGSYVLNIVSPGGFLQSGDDLETAILISLFTDREANLDDVIPDGTNDPRGWVGDLGQDYKIGSRLWLLSRSKQDAETLRKASDYIAEALQWLLDDGVVGQFDITTEWTQASFLGAKVVAYKGNDASTSMNFSWVWKAIN